MKLIVLLISVLLFSCAFSELIQIKKREFTPDPNAVDIQFLGSCEEFSSLAGSMSVNAPSDTGCLPILDTLPFNDANDLTAQYICNQISRYKSLIRVVEVYDPATPHSDAIGNLDVIIGFKSSRPFRSPGSRFLRRPTCTVQQDFCSNSPSTVVESCQDNRVTTEKGWVLNSDIVYIVPSYYTGAIYTCKQADTSCCVYVAPTIGVTTTGFCPTSASNSLNNFPHGYHHERPQYRPQQTKKPQQQQGYASENSEDDK